jgi:tetratricopeptide (TPR) repeat protein
LTQHGPADFASVFREAITEAQARLGGKLKKELARDCGLRPDRFSHLQSGLRRPSRQDVLGIVRGLRLDEAAAGRLLRAAGFPPLSEQSVALDEAAGVADRLGDPERALAQFEVEADLARIRRAWLHYVTVQSHNQDRQWAGASDLHDQGMEHYWALRAMAARYLAQVSQATATARAHLNRLPEAEARCHEGLAAARASGSMPFQVMLLTRLGSIQRLRSNYEGAEKRYEEALAILESWASSGDDATGRAWRAHWTARIQRMQGWLELFLGHPRRALEKLEASLSHFKRVRHRYELAQVCYGMGWANTLRGNVEAAISWNRQGLDHAVEHNRQSGRADDRSILQGNLYLGGDHLDVNDLATARRYLEEAARLGADRRLREYHEVGRVRLLLGRLETRERRWEAAHGHLRAALEFFDNQEEQVLIATAHNEFGDFFLASSGGRDIQRAAHHYQKALDAARASRPQSSYYECAALVNLARVRVRGGLASAELTGIRDDLPNSESGWDVDRVIGKARAIGGEHGYRNHLARLAVVEAELALQRGDLAGASRAAGDALHVAHNFSLLVLGEVREQLRGLGGLPEELLDAPIDSGA